MINIIQTYDLVTTYNLIFRLLNDYKENHISLNDRIKHRRFLKISKQENPKMSNAGHILCLFHDDEVFELIKSEYRLFREWFKYPQKYDEDSEIKDLVDKYNLSKNCNLSRHAKHLYLYLKHFEIGFDDYFAENIKENINFFIPPKNIKGE